MDGSFVNSLVDSFSGFFKFLILFFIMLVIGAGGIGYCIGKYGIPYTVRIEKVEK